MNNINKDFIFNQLFEWVKYEGNTSQPIIHANFSVAVASNTGVLRERNEDRAAYSFIKNREGYAIFVAIVCDGMGGMESGDLAASTALSSVIGELAFSSEKISSSLLTKIIREANNRVFQQLNGKGGTTLSIVICDSDNQILGANIGDSRIFAWSPGKSIEKLSVDDTVEEQLRRANILDTSIFNELEIGASLTQFVGIGNSIEIRILELGNLHDFGFILSSDGSWHVNLEAFIQISRSSKNSNDVIRRTIAFTNWVGGVDNTSLVAAESCSLIIEQLKKSLIHIEKLEVVIWTSEGKMVLPIHKNIESNVSASNIQNKNDANNFNTPPIKTKKQTRKKTKKIAIQDDLLSSNISLSTSPKNKEEDLNLSNQSIVKITTNNDD